MYYKIALQMKYLFVCDIYESQVITITDSRSSNNYLLEMICYNLFCVINRGYVTSNATHTFIIIAAILILYTTNDVRYRNTTVY